MLQKEFYLSQLRKSFKRVNKTKFKNWFNKEENNDKEFFICSNKVNPCCFFSSKNKVSDVKNHDDFENIDRFINHFHYYNCNLFETGYYCKFYIEI